LTVVFGVPVDRVSAQDVLLENHVARNSRATPTTRIALEAVCLKAMAHEPEDRYATPRALADDLDRRRL
jgi:hypothetical protein